MTNKYIGKRRMARIASLHALYQAEVNPSPMEKIASDFIKNYGSQTQSRKQNYDFESGFLGFFDINLFNELTVCLWDKRGDIDHFIAQSLKEARPMDRMEILLRNLLRMAAYEILFRKEAIQVVVDEYIALCDAYFDDAETGFLHKAIYGMSNHSASLS